MGERELFASCSFTLSRNVPNQEKPLIQKITNLGFVVKKVEPLIVEKGPASAADISSLIAVVDHEFEPQVGEDFEIIDSVPSLDKKEECAQSVGSFSILNQPNCYQSFMPVGKNFQNKEDKGFADSENIPAKELEPPMLAHVDDITDGEILELEKQVSSLNLETGRSSVSESVKPSIHTSESSSIDKASNDDIGKRMATSEDFMRCQPNRASNDRAFNFTSKARETEFSQETSKKLELLDMTTPNMDSKATLTLTLTLSISPARPGRQNSAKRPQKS
ncbi:hypothetical protein EGW08_003199 [Elysia chlorotica]|uniref:Uncharacterized protein n=1 Tax=Elysia chlorotica TaxID=188477 RepID=A0A3S1BUH0_ELYCH|nr:hypothetical protein EGW08_003199 [Elysia chlorotica]